MLVIVLLIVVGVPAALLAFAYAVGSVLPREHVAARRLRISPDAEPVWQRITDHPREPDWRRKLDAVERQPDRDGHPVWREVHGSSSMTFETVELTPPVRIVRRIADRGLPFGGAWTIEVAPATGGGTSVTVTEHGEVYNPVFRFVSRYVLGHTRTIDAYLEDLAASFGERAEPGPVFGVR
jgi:hypothetical protein